MAQQIFYSTVDGCGWPLYSQSLYQDQQPSVWADRAHFSRMMIEMAGVRVVAMELAECPTKLKAATLATESEFPSIFAHLSKPDTYADRSGARTDGITSAKQGLKPSNG